MRLVSPLQQNGHGYKRYKWLFLWDKMHFLNAVISILITGISGHNCGVISQVVDYPARRHHMHKSCSASLSAWMDVP
jgi:hypothetical protein